MARRKLIPGNITFWGHDVCVDWAEPEPEVDPEIMNKALLHAHCMTYELRSCLSEY